MFLYLVPQGAVEIHPTYYFIIMKTLKLFNAVTAKISGKEAHISEHGFIIEPNALWAKKEILKFYKKQRLDGVDLNKTFHKSWQTIKNSSRFELFIEQFKHYISTYGSNFQAEMYVPDEFLDIPELKISYKVIRALPEDQMRQKCLDLLASGIAMKEETIDDVISVLVDELDYSFTSQDVIKNKEAVVKIAEIYGVYPDNPVEFFRYIIYRTTNTTLLIKSPALIAAIKESNYNPAPALKKYGLEKVAEIFNRFKPLFLAYKGKCPKTINKISKLSKKLHKPMVQNPLGSVTSSHLSILDEHWLKNATAWSLFKALSACHSRIKGQDAFVYRIRNGKSFAKEDKKTLKRYNILGGNYDFILNHLKKRFDLRGKKIFIPKNVRYALPTSEKMFVGNIPTGTRFTGKKLAVGIYWEDNWGARDLDLSGLNIAGKIGWNVAYKNSGGSLMYSGDLTSAPNGAVEYLYANKGLNDPTLVENNVYYGNTDCGYKIIVGKGDKVTRDYMFDPNNLFIEVKTEAVQKQMILGMFIPKKDKQSFVLLNFGAGMANVSGSYEVSNIATKALYQQWKNPLSFNKLVKVLGAEIVKDKEDATHDLSLENLEKDSFTKIFA